MRAISLVTPSAVSPFTPAPINRSTTRLRLSRSRSPPAVNGVGSTEYTPSSFIRLLFSDTVSCKRLLHKETYANPRRLHAFCRVRPDGGRSWRHLDVRTGGSWRRSAEPHVLL